MSVKFNTNEKKMKQQEKKIKYLTKDDLKFTKNKFLSMEVNKVL